MTELFTDLCAMGWAALPVMAVVLAARWLLRRAPKRYTYLLWAVVAFRLVCPATVSTPVGLVAPETARRQVEAAREALQESARQPEPVQDTTPRSYIPEAGAPPVTAASPEAVRRAADPMAALTALWLGGMAAMLGYILWSFLRLRRMVRTAVRREGNVWECDRIPTPFVLGLLRPRIYIPFRMGDAERAFVLAHEREHLRWRDHWAKALALGILTVYWWHPGVWLCWVLLCRDMELRCDEAVLFALGDDIKADYSRSLLSFALDRRFPVALAFGEHDAARRVRHVLDWKRARPAAVFLALAAVVLATAVCGTNAGGYSSWIRAGWRPFLSPSYDRMYRYQISRSYQSYLLYQERYDHGELAAREALAWGTFGRGPGEIPRRGGVSLYVDARPIDLLDPASPREVLWRVSLDSVEPAPLEALPAGDYGEIAWSWQGRDLAEDTAILSAAVAEDEGKLTGGVDVPEGYAAPRSIQEHDIVLVLRLRLDEGDPDALLASFEAEDRIDFSAGNALARRLYEAPRTPEAILEVLGAEEALGRYTVQDAARGYLSLLFYDCPVPLPDRDTVLWKYSMVLLALLEDCRETTWNWIDGGEPVRETNGGLWNTRSWLNAHGLGESIQEYGKSPEALRQLLGALYPEYGGGAPVSGAGEALYAMRGDLSLLMEAVVSPVLGNFLWTVTRDGTLEITLANPLIYPESPLSSRASAEGGKAVASDLSCLLLALSGEDEVWAIRWLDGGEPVEFSYLRGGEMFMENAAAIWTEARSGNALDVRACGQGAAGITLLLDALGLDNPGGPFLLTAEGTVTETRELPDTAAVG